MYQISPWIILGIICSQISCYCCRLTHLKALINCNSDKFQIFRLLFQHHFSPSCSSALLSFIFNFPLCNFHTHTQKSTSCTRVFFLRNLSVNSFAEEAKKRRIKLRRLSTVSSAFASTPCLRLRLRDSHLTLVCFTCHFSFIQREHRQTHTHSESQKHKNQIQITQRAEE